MERKTQIETENGTKMENANEHAGPHFNTSILYANKVFPFIHENIIH